MRDFASTVYSELRLLAFPLRNSLSANAEALAEGDLGHPFIFA